MPPHDGHVIEAALSLALPLVGALLVALAAVHRRPGDGATEAGAKAIGLNVDRS